MGIAYDTAQWGNFFFAEVGASAALVGLLFVAVSINLAKIIAFPSLPGRAFEALTMLVMVLFVGTFALVPGQSTHAIGAEVLATALACSATIIVIQRTAPPVADAPRMWMISRVIATQLATLPMIAGGASLLAGRGGGLYWTVGGVIASFLAALVDAWVLLVEIQR
jgi:modulator of FtsH protease